MSDFENNIVTSIHKRRSYHTNVKILAKANLLPEEMLDLIPKSNISRWKYTDFSDTLEVKSFDLENKHIEDIKLLMNHEKLLKTCTAVLRIKNSIISVLRRKTKKTEEKKVIVNTIDRVKDAISLERATRYFKISLNKYYHWSKQFKNKCLETLIDKCPRIYTNQLSNNEIQKISELVKEEKFKGWPIYSIAWYAIKNKILQVSVTSWYKYTKLLGYKRQVPENPKKNYQPVIANSPGEKLHADVTIFKPLNKSKVYIYIVMDNFSRYILGWKASLQLSSEIFVENLKEVYYKQLIPINPVRELCSLSADFSNKVSPVKEFFSNGVNKPIELIVDGGPENNNKKVDGFISDIDGAIKKLIAKKDIIFSNSVVEAMNKILKYGFLFQRDIPDFESTVKHLEKIIPIYNNERPHLALNGYTPEEVFNGISRNEEVYKKDLQEAYYRRIKENKEMRCRNCDDGGKLELAIA